MVSICQPPLAAIQKFYVSFTHKNHFLFYFHYLNNGLLYMFYYKLWFSTFKKVNFFFASGLQYFLKIVYSNQYYNPLFLSICKKLINNNCVTWKMEIKFWQWWEFILYRYKYTYAYLKLVKPSIITLSSHVVEWDCSKSRNPILWIESMHMSEKHKYSVTLRY